MGKSQGAPVPLAGLVSDDAQRLYVRLRGLRSMAKDEFARHGVIAAELVERGLVGEADHGRAVEAIEAVTALRTLVDRERSRLVSAQERMLAGWEQLMALVPAGPVAQSEAGVEVVRGAGDVLNRAGYLQSVATRVVRVAVAGSARPRLPERPRVRRKLLVQSDATGDLVRLCAANTQVRVRARVQIPLVHVDTTAALVVFGPSGDRALLVRAPDLVGVLGEWFDLAWDSPGTTSVGGASGLPAPLAQVLAMMPFDNDETIARKLRLSVSTVRRRVQEIYNALGVDNRFAAGMAAARLGWI